MWFKSFVIHSLCLALDVPNTSVENQACPEQSLDDNNKQNHSYNFNFKSSNKVFIWQPPVYRYSQMKDSLPSDSPSVHPCLLFKACWTATVAPQGHLLSSMNKPSENGYFTVSICPSYRDDTTWPSRPKTIIWNSLLQTTAASEDRSILNIASTYIYTNCSKHYSIQ